ncbi:MAG: type II toxin-antitoxin system PemK/MazF family toxin [Acidobacteria bacterium]|nr:type II toxin-antitoxin system PemK/MazF family toxin [Acidobacteriota bacterium]
MQRGDVRWYRLGRPDKQRPVVVLTRGAALEFLSDVTVAPVTTTIRTIPTEVILTREDGMPRTCAANLDHVQTVSRARVGALITTLGTDRMTEIADALRFALDV